MNGAELYTLVCDTLLGGIQMNSVAFYQLLNMVKNALEGERPFVQLRVIQTSQSWNTSDTYLTGSKTLPTDFRSLMKNGVAKTVDASGQQGPELKVINMQDRLDYKDTSGFFYIDYANGVYYCTGTADKAYTIHFPYKKKSADITASTTWIFPTEYHIGLANIVAAIHKAGIDYDDINSRMAAQNTADYQRVRQSMINWDTDLQLNALPDDRQAAGARETL